MQHYLYLHIGAPKTGSTALQHFFCNNRKQLLDHNILYPEASLRAYGHHDIAFLVAGDYPKWATPQEKGLGELLGLINQEIESHQGHLLMSSENFYLLPAPQRLKEQFEALAIIPNYQIKIIINVRRQDEAHESWYNQTVKAQGYTHTIDESINEFQKLWDYNERLQEWEQSFGRDNIVVCPYYSVDTDKQRLFIDFLSVMGLDSSDFDLPDTPINNAINKDLLEFQRLMNRLPLSHQEKRTFHQELMELTTASQDLNLFNNSSLLTTKQRNEIMANYAESNRRLSEKHLKGADLFPSRTDLDDTFEYQETALNEEKMAYILGWILSKKD